MMKLLITFLGLLLLTISINIQAADISIKETPKKTPIIDISKESNINIIGSTSNSKIKTIYIRITSTRDGKSYTSSANVKKNKFSVKYPKNFKKAPSLISTMYLIDASEKPDFIVTSKEANQAEAAVITYNGKNEMPELPSGFCNDLRDKSGNTDNKSAEYPVIKSLMNHYMKSKAAFDVNVGNADFNLDKDMNYYKKNLALFDFDNRDRNWDTPLNNRPGQTFWKSVWNTWFNFTNDHPLDGNPKNPDPNNYMPYAFTNDYTDILIMYIMRQDKKIHPLDDNLNTICEEGIRNLIAMQNQEDSNFALTDHRGQREKYTKGAFRYGMFIDGNFMTEGTGWFYNPAFLDYINGGVLNGRALWGLGEFIKYNPKSPYADPALKAFVMGLQFCMNDGFSGGYTKKTQQGNIYWKDIGEHAYMTIGMCAAASQKPNITAFTDNNNKSYSLKDATVMALNAMTDKLDKDGKWEIYPNTDSMAVAALTDGYMTFPNHPDAKKWLAAAQKSADSWLNLKVLKSEFKGEVINFGLRLSPDEMTYNWNRVSPSWTSANYIFYYQTGHWIHALSRLYMATGNNIYKVRTEKMIGYLLGNNPMGTRLLNETGGVYNWSEDRNGDGYEDYYGQTMYPESTAFSQIGIMHYLNAVNKFTK